MAVAESFFVRILIYGLVGVVPGGNGTTILLPKVDGHVPYVAFEAECQGGCPTVRPFGRRLSGFALGGEQIIIESIATADTVEGGPASILATPPLPNNKDESKSLFWVPSMVNVLRGTGNNGKVDARCLQGNPVNCRLAVAGRAHFVAGKELGTCQLIANEGGISSLDKIFAFDFKKSQGGPSNWKQGLAEVVEVVSTVNGPSVELKLISFAGRTRSVVLKPELCDSMTGAKCVDIYIANMPKVAANPIEQFQGDHFPVLYKLLAVEPSASFELKPFADLNTKKEAGDVQPLCRSVQVAANVSYETASKLTGAAKFSLGIRSALFRSASKFYFMSPETRPICPMAAFSP